MDYLIYCLVAFLLVVLGMNKWNSVRRKSAESKLLIKDAEISDSVLKTNQENLSKQKENLKKEHEEKVTNSLSEPAEDFWKKRLK